MDAGELAELAKKLHGENSELHQKLDVSAFAFDKIPEPSDEYDRIAEGTHNPVTVAVPSLGYTGAGGGLTRLYEGDNFPVLASLHEGHKDSVDVIYLDPPYNTGNDFIYNDKRKSTNKTRAPKGSLFKHSAWLSFMERRLLIAKDMLRDSGVILISIDDNEYAHLKLLMDEVFGEANYIGTVTWQGSPSSLSKFTSGGVDYLLAYGKNITAASKWRVKKPHVDEMLAVVERSMKRFKSPEKANKVLSEFISKKKTKLGKGLTAYNKVDEHGRIYSDSSLTNSLYRPNLKYPVTDPATGRVYNPPANGWKLSEAKMDELISKDLVLFQGRKYPRKKMLLSEYMYALPAQSFFAPRTQGSSALTKIIGRGKFHFPKNVEVLKDWLGAVCDKEDAVIMDFFAGSGTTGQAVAELNAADGGTRSCILVTSNENNISRDVTQKRIQRVLSGKDWADGKVHPTLPGSLEYFRLAWEEYDGDTKIIKRLRTAGFLPSGAAE